MQPTEHNRLQRVQLDRETYEVMDIRKGGMGMVWLLRRPPGAPYGTIYGQTCAVKTFDADEQGQEAIIEQELGNWVSLNDEHIVPLMKIARLNFKLAALMGLMPGSLADYMDQQTRVDDNVIKSILLDVLRGLDFAYSERNLAHLDLKPQNLLLTSAHSAHVKISDWGLSRLVSQPNHLKRYVLSQTAEKTQFAAGTAAYMAPERFSGSWTISPAVDVFSLGMIGIQLMSGEIPSFDNKDASPIGAARLITSHQYFKRAKTLLSNHRGPLVPLLLQMIEPNPIRRPHRYAELISVLEKM